MSGDSNGTTFRPYETLNRAEVAKVISKLLEKGQSQNTESFDVQDFMKDVEKMKAVENEMTLPENTNDNMEMKQSDEGEQGDEVGFVERLKMVFSKIGSLF